MPRVYYVHWNFDEAAQTVADLLVAGHDVRCESGSGETAWRQLAANPPDVLVISLARLPSHGRRVAAVTQESKRLRHLPLVFVGGEPEKVAKARKQFPRAAFCTPDGIMDAIGAAIAAATKPAAPSAANPRRSKKRSNAKTAKVSKRKKSQKKGKRNKRKPKRKKTRTRRSAPGKSTGKKRTSRPRRRTPRPPRPPRRR